MKLNKNLILIGMMASGKSTIGRLLAKKLNIKFFDTDFIIEKKTKMKIVEIFRKKGEPYFRNLEKKITLNLLNKNNCVISLGGGAFIEPVIREVVLKTSISFWLDLNIKNLSKRFKTLKKRPLVDENNLEESLNNIYEKRKELYNLANFIYILIIKNHTEAKVLSVHIIQLLMSENHYIL